MTTRVAKSSKEIAAVRMRESITGDPPLLPLRPVERDVSDGQILMTIVLHGSPQTDCDLPMVAVEVIP